MEPDADELDRLEEVGEMVETPDGLAIKLDADGSLVPLRDPRRAPFKRITSPGMTDAGRLFVTIDWDGRRLSITGVEGPKANGDAHGSCGQTGIPELKTYAPAYAPIFGFPSREVERLRAIWDRWHLNDMRAGCEHQRAAGWDGETRAENEAPRRNNAHRKNPVIGRPCAVCGYRYGTAWLYEEVPTDVLEFLRGLPDDSNKMPQAWRN